MNQKLSRKESFSQWWRLEGKIECAGAAIILIILLSCWGNLLAEGIIGICVAIWALVKIYFRRKQWAFLSLAAIWALQQGISALIQYINI